MKKRVHLVRYTPDWTHDERVNVLWLWVMTHKDKYDPNKGTVEIWIDSVHRRIIDVYRKEKGNIKYAQAQFPVMEGEDGDVIPYESFIEDTREVPRYNKDDLEEIERAMDCLTDKNKLILRNVTGQYDDKSMAAQLGITPSCLYSHRLRNKNKVRNVLKGRGYDTL